MILETQANPDPRGPSDSKSLVSGSRDVSRFKNERNLTAASFNDVFKIFKGGPRHMHDTVAQLPSIVSPIVPMLKYLSIR